MALISNPFIANSSKQLSPDELIQALRADIVGEYEAIIGYEAHAMATQDQRIQQSLYKIADEERKHVGQLQELLAVLNPNESQLIEQGKQFIKQQQFQNVSQPLPQGAKMPNQFNQ